VSDEQQEAQDGGGGPARERLEDQLDWYSRKSAAAQKAYKQLKLGQLMVGTAVPVIACLEISSALTAALAAVVVVAEGVQQLYQWQTNWVQYRSTAEALKREKYLYLAAAGPYHAEDRHRVLAERVEELISQEHASWIESRQREKAPESARIEYR